MGAGAARAAASRNFCLPSAGPPRRCLSARSHSHAHIISTDPAADYVTVSPPLDLGAVGRVDGYRVVRQFPIEIGGGNNSNKKVPESPLGTKESAGLALIITRRRETVLAKSLGKLFIASSCPPVHAYRVLKKSHSGRPLRTTAAVVAGSLSDGLDWPHTARVERRDRRRNGRQLAGVQVRQNPLPPTCLRS